MVHCLLYVALTLKFQRWRSDYPCVSRACGYEIERSCTFSRSKFPLTSPVAIPGYWKSDKLSQQQKRLTSVPKIPAPLTKMRRSFVQQRQDLQELDSLRRAKRGVWRCNDSLQETMQESKENLMWRPRGR